MTTENSIYNFRLTVDRWPLGLGTLLSIGSATQVALNEDGTSRMAICWPGHEEDLRELSRQYLEVRFTLMARRLGWDVAWEKVFVGGELIEE